MIPLKLQSHEILIQFVTDQLVLQCHVLHFSVSVWGLDHFVHTLLYHSAECILPIHLLVPTDLVSVLSQLTYFIGYAMHV
jgi:hypothetical protein